MAKTLVLLAISLVSLTVGSLLTVAQADTTGMPATPQSLRVPSMRIGDVATYSRLDENNQSVPGPTFRVLRLETVPDVRLRPLQTVRLEQAELQAHRYPNGTTGQHLQVMHFNVDLLSRQTVRMSPEWELTGAGLSQTLAFMPIGPIDWYKFEEIGLAAQGHELVQGHHFNRTYPPLDDSPVHARGGRGGGGATMPAGIVLHSEMRFRMSHSEGPLWDGIQQGQVTVGRAALIDGRLALELRTDVEAYGNEYRLSAWFTADSPFPVLIERDQGQLVDGVWESRHKSIEYLSSLTQGDRPVPWQSGEPTPAPDLQRGAHGTRVPPDGDGSRLAYPLSRAIKDVQADPRFAAWTALHPDNVLVSATNQVGRFSTSQEPSSVWQLAFAEPSGSAHIFSTERGTRPVPIVQDHGDTSVPSFSLRDLPTAPAAVAPFEAAWRAARSEEFQGVDANFVHWGYELDFAHGAPCLGAGTSSKRPESTQQLKTLYVGHSSSGTCIRPAESTAGSVLVGRVDHGVVFGQIEHQTSWKPFDPTQQADRTRAPAVTAQGRQFQVPQPRDLMVPAAASVGVFALLTTLYFLPALKFLGAGGLTVLPGYAKLKKSELLDNRLRDQIVQAVRADPGQSITDLVKKTGAGWGTVTYHLRVLEQNKILTSIVDGRHHRFFPPETVEASLRGQVAALKNERTRALFEIIQNESGLIQQALAQRAGISNATISWHVRRLEDVGLVARIRKGFRIHLIPNAQPTVESAYDPDEAVEVT